MGYVGSSGNSWLMTVMGSIKLGLQRVGNLDRRLIVLKRVWCDWEKTKMELRIENVTEIGLASTKI
jgi:hypothetical protein